MTIDSDFDPDGTRLPIKIETTSNGEYIPQPLSKAEQHGKKLAYERVEKLTRRLGHGRRAFLTSSMGAAATLLALNEANALAGIKGGSFDIAKDAGEDFQLAQASLEGDEFIFDDQTHCVDPSGKWRKGMTGIKWTLALQLVFKEQSKECGWFNFECFSAQNLIKEVYLDSDTDVAVLSALWGGQKTNPTPIDYAVETRTLMETLGENSRGFIQGGVLANEEGAIDFMDEQAETYKVDSWKLYPQWGPKGKGYYMDDPDVAFPIYEQARKLGIKTICAHRGLPLPTFDYEYSTPTDIVRAARTYEDLTFVCYHSGYEPDFVEGPYSPDSPGGVDRFIRTYIEQGFERNEGNLYAELGGLWHEVMTKPDEAAHVMGKLLKYVGEERICWGTDSIWYGSPQDQIQAFRTFQISEEFQEKYGYPALTRHAKERIFGLNSAEIYGLDVAQVRRTEIIDPAGRTRTEYQTCPNPSFQTYGPQTRRDFFARLNATGGRPG